MLRWQNGFLDTHARKFHVRLHTHACFIIIIIIIIDNVDVVVVVVVVAFVTYKTYYWLDTR